MNVRKAVQSRCWSLRHRNKCCGMMPGTRQRRRPSASGCSNRCDKMHLSHRLGGGGGSAQSRHPANLQKNLESAEVLNRQRQQSKIMATVNIPVLAFNSVGTEAASRPAVARQRAQIARSMLTDCHFC